MSSTLAAPRSVSSPFAAVPVAITSGDGIGPEIMKATLRVLAAAERGLNPPKCGWGRRSTWRATPPASRPTPGTSLRRTGVLLKAPITTPQGGGYKSLNVTAAQDPGPVRQRAALPSPTRRIVATQHPAMDVVIIRENEEDLYAGIEHRQTREVIQCLKLITRPGCEKIVRYAFEYARANGRKKVTAAAPKTTS